MPVSSSVFPRRGFLRCGLSYGVLAAAAPLASLPAIAQTSDLDLATALSPRYVGSAADGIQLAEYFSLTCSHCAHFHTDTYPRLKSEWIDSGRVRLEYRDFPLDGLAIYAHALARSVPVAAYANMIDILFARQGTWATAAQPLFELQKIARFAGIGSDSFAAIIDNRPLQTGIVELAQEGARRFNITATPSFVINNRKTLTGNQSYDELAAHLADA